jgi:hypothetical protein
MENVTSTVRATTIILNMCSNLVAIIWRISATNFI